MRRTPPGSVVSLGLHEIIKEPFQKAGALCAVGRVFRTVGAVLRTDIQGYLQGLVFPQEIQVQSTVPVLALTLLQGNREVEQGPVRPKHLHSVPIAVGRLEGTTVGTHHKISHPDLSRRGASAEDVPDEQEFRILGNEFGPHPGNAEVVEPAVDLGVRSRACPLLPRASVFMIVHLTDQGLGQKQQEKKNRQAKNH